MQVFDNLTNLRQIGARLLQRDHIVLRQIIGQWHSPDIFFDEPDIALILLIIIQNRNARMPQALQYLRLPKTPRVTHKAGRVFFDALDNAPLVQIPVSDQIHCCGLRLIDRLLQLVPATRKLLAYRSLPPKHVYGRLVSSAAVPPFLRSRCLHMVIPDDFSERNRVYESLRNCLSLVPESFCVYMT